MSTIGIMLNALESHGCNPRKCGVGHEAHCPTHEDHRASLSVGQGEDGKVLLKCQAGCGTADVVAALGLTMKDLFDDATARQNGGGLKIEKTYDYTDERGALLYQVVRTTPKGFRQRRPDGVGGWIWNMKNVRHVIYRLPLVLKAVKADSTIYVCEGEKDCDALNRLGQDGAGGFVATCNSGGAAKWRPEFSKMLRGAKQVIVIADKDPAGYKHAADVARSLASAVVSIDIVEAAHGKDAFDHLAAALRLDQLVPVKKEDLRDAAEMETKPRTLTASKIEIGQSLDIPRFARTDAGNGELFAHLYGDRVRFDHRRGRWLLWSGDRWMPECQAEIRGLAKKAARARYHAATNIGDPEERKKEAAWAIASESRQKVEAGLYFAQAEPPIADKGDGWDADPWLLGCENGVVDLRTGTLRPGRPGDRITMTTGIIFDTSVKAPRWDRFLQEVFRCDAGLIGWVQRAAGYSASGDVREQVWFLKYGAGSNGKGAFDRATHAALGDYFANTPFSTIEINNRPSIPNDLAALVGRRFVTANESAETARLNESRVKALSGGDALTARFLNHEFFTFTPTLKLWASVNHLPRVTDLSYGFWRRVRLIPFTVQFAGQAIDKDLDRKLRAEGPGILAWIVRGAVAWAQKSLDPAPECVLAATETYRQESDPLGEFVAERCVVGAECRVGATAFYKEYTTWCDGRSIRERERLSSTAFGRRMAEKFEKDHGKSGTLYRGVGLQIGDGLTEKPVTSRSLPIQNPLRESDGENPSQPVTRHRGTDGRHDL